MDDEGWIAEERRLAGPCPSCRAAGSARPIAYGMPMRSDYERLRDRVSFAGCVVPEVPHRWSCGSCDAEWGLRRLESDQP